jgi:hypothetical protein
LHIGISVYWLRFNYQICENNALAEKKILHSNEHKYVGSNF